MTPSTTSREKQLILVTGGVRAGKSDFAQQLAQRLSSGPKSVGEMGRQVMFVATAEALDAEMEERIRRHRTSRPADWSTVEEPVHLSEAIGKAPLDAGIVLIDCLNLWVGNLLLWHEANGETGIEERTLDSTSILLDLYQRSRATFILVSNEVGMGLVPSHPLGRLFRDILGKVNQRVAARADKVYLLVAGLPIELKALADPHSSRPKDEECAAVGSAQTLRPPSAAAGWSAAPK